jgi:hypothetical protein
MHNAPLDEDVKRLIIEKKKQMPYKRNDFISNLSSKKTAF